MERLAEGRGRRDRGHRRHDEQQRADRARHVAAQQVHEQQQGDDPHAPRQPADGEHELQRDVGRREEIHALCAALAALPTQQRDVIVLRELYGFSYAEVGAALGLTGPAVESLVFRSRRRLQEQLRPLRSALGVLALPVTLRDSLAQALPGFGGAGASAGAGRDRA